MKKIFAVVALCTIVSVVSVSAQISVLETRRDSEPKPAACQKKEDEGILKGLFKGIKGIIIHILDIDGSDNPSEPLCGIIIH